MNLRKCAVIRVSKSMFLILLDRKTNDDHFLNVIVYIFVWIFEIRRIADMYSAKMSMFYTVCE